MIFPLRDSQLSSASMANAYLSLRATVLMGRLASRGRGGVGRVGKGARVRLLFVNQAFLIHDLE